MRSVNHELTEAIRHLTAALRVHRTTCWTCRETISGCSDAEDMRKELVALTTLSEQVETD